MPPQFFEIESSKYADKHQNVIGGLQKVIHRI
jgi:hypothetical protein